MKNLSNTFLIAVLLWLTACTGQNDPERLGHIGYPPLPVHDIAFFSESLQREMHINVVLPGGYEESEIEYPVLYLLHGFTSNYFEFVNIGVPEYLNRMDMMVVMVDAGNSSYANWAVSENGDPLNFEDHVIKDVIAYVDKNYRTISERKGRAINGISMGAAGAITLGLTYPELFCSIAGHSGGYSKDGLREGLGKEPEPNFFFDIMKKDTTMYYLGIDIPGFSTMKDRTPQGTMFTSIEQIDRIDPYINVLKIPKEDLPHIYIDAGTGDGAITPTRDFAKFLMENDIPFVFGQSTGVHEEDYWGREISLSMAVQYSVLLRHIWGRKFEVYNPYMEIFKHVELPDSIRQMLPEEEEQE